MIGVHIRSSFPTVVITWPHNHTFFKHNFHWIP